MENNACKIPRRIIFTCAGTYNVGQIANQAAMDLQQEGIAQALCLAAVTGNQEDIRVLADTADRVVGVDGCEHACAKKTLKHAGLDITDHVTVTDLSITKKPQNGAIDTTAVTRVKNAVKGRLESVAGGQY